MGPELGIARELLALPSTVGGHEVWLSGPEREDHAVLVDEVIAARLSAWRDDPAWALLRRQHARPARPAVWAEWDQGGAAPSLFVAAPRWRFGEAARAAMTEAIADEVRELDGEVDASVLARTIASLPAACWIKYVGRMTRPGAAGVRLVIADMAWSELTAWLVAIGWPGSLASLDRLIEVASGLAPRASIHIDLAAGLGAAIGFELVAHDWRAALVTLVAVGWARADRTERVMEWPDGEARSISHLKLGHTADARIVSKAYLLRSLR